MNYRDLKNLGNAARGRGIAERELLAILRELSHSRRSYEVWSNFIEMSAIALSNAIDKRMFEQREARYLQIIGKYEPKEVQLICQAHAYMVMAMELRGYSDFLGEMFMSLDLGSEAAGQFFTPFPICQMMANLVGGLDDAIKTKGFVEVNEPACGGGAMILALAEHLRERGFNPGSQMLVVAQDIDPLAVQMCYLQLSYFGVSAVVIRGNTLAAAEPAPHDVWFTPCYFLQQWPARLRSRRLENAVRELLTTPTLEGLPEQLKNSAHEVPHKTLEIGNNVISHSLFEQPELF
jgi:N-6 DNA Methylase